MAHLADDCPLFQFTMMDGRVVVIHQEQGRLAGTRVWNAAGVDTDVRHICVLCLALHFASASLLQTTHKL